MSQVRFYGMSLDFEFVRTNFNNQDFGKFILQPYMADAEKWRDEFTLLIYALKVDGSVMKKKDLKIDKKEFFKAKTRVEIGNIPFSKTQVQKFIDEDNKPGITIESLYFHPYQFEDYVAYKVTAILQGAFILTGVNEDIKPSPPADPYQ